MNILLDAYFDQNFGDDVFIKCITEMFPKYKFYTFLEFYPQKICDWAERLPNLFLLPECNVFLNKNMFDAYLCVGGDIFPDQGDFEKRKSYVKAVKKCNGVVAFLGFSLFHEYSSETHDDICELMEQADIVAPRDEWSVSLLKKWMPDKEIPVMADLAFSFFDKVEKKHEPTGVLGISVRKPIQAEEEKIEKYCADLAGTIDKYLVRDDFRRVRILSLSDGTSSDAEIARIVLEKVEHKDRVEQYIYTGDINACCDVMAECDVLICTRLHAMIACIAMNIRFIPIVYEVKQEHVLEEIRYQGKWFRFEELSGLYDYLEDSIAGGVSCAEGKRWEEESLNRYLGKSAGVLKSLNGALENQKCVDKFVKSDVTGALCSEKQYGKSQAEEVIRKNQELEELADEIEHLQKIVQECQESAEEYRNTIEECNKTNREYFSIIEELNVKYKEMEQIKEDYIATQQAENNRLNAVINDLQQEYLIVQERMNQLQDTCAQLELANTESEQKKVVYEDILEKARPYFASRKGQVITKQMSNLLEMISKGAKEDWETIRKFYE